MTPSIEEALRLLRLAERDLQTYRILAAHPDASLAATCFHALQSVEKALKAVLTAHGAIFPRTAGVTHRRGHTHRRGRNAPPGSHRRGQV